VNFVPSAELKARVDELVTHYPSDRPRAAALWLCHLVQDESGQLGAPEVEWIAGRLGVPNVDIYELVSFYPMFSAEPKGKFHLKVCRSISCHMAGAGKLVAAVKDKLGIDVGETTADGRFHLSEFECLADCGAAPVGMVNDEHHSNLDVKKFTALIERLAANGQEHVPLPQISEPHPKEHRLLLEGLAGTNEPESLESYRQRGGYRGLPKALGMTAEAIVQEVKTSGLRGRGGAGFPTGMKWSFIDKKSQKPVYLIVNGDESEPGTFKDRVLLHHRPFMLLEGLTIAAHAVGARVAYIYVRGEFPHAVQILEKAVATAKAAGLLGKNILGKGLDLEVYLHRGAGAYICGEETGLIESLEGKRAYPRIKPPFPAVSGVFQCPTVVNNVETLCNIPHIIEKGGAWFAGLGVKGSSGTRLLCVSGRVRRPGVYEIENGKLTLRELIFDVCGGLEEGRSVKGVIPGGTSMPILEPSKLDTSLDFDAIQAAGSLAGSGGIVVLDDRDDAVDMTLNISQFYAHESCGQCTPCREGTRWMEEVLHRVHRGKGRPDDVPLLLNIANNIDGKTICPLGEAAAWPVRALVTKYRSEFESACRPGSKPHASAPASSDEAEKALRP
jgi:NADH-quinone oxidoreductase subunit F